MLFGDRLCGMHFRRSHYGTDIVCHRNCIINQLNFYRTNVSSKASLSDATAESVLNIKINEAAL